MDHRKVHLWEKLHVELVGGLALVAVYFWLWPAVGWADAETAVAFLPTGQLDGITGLAVLLLGVAAVCAAVTVSSRPFGGMLAALVALCGVSCRCPGTRTLFWQAPDVTAGAMFSLLAAEVLLLGLLFCLAAFVVEIVRAAVGRLLPTWAWKDPLADLTDGQRLAALPDAVSGRPPGRPLLTALLMDTFIRFGKIGSRHAGRRQWDRPMFLRCLACGLTGPLVALLPLLLLMQSPERGQGLFALIASFLLGGLVAHQRFPVPYSVVAILMAAGTGAAFYATAAISSFAQGPNAWMFAPVHSGPNMLPYAAALPIDWVAAGGGGAVIGFWISERIHEHRYLIDENDEPEEMDF